MSRTQVGRLAMRVEMRPEGTFWVGYYALTETMEGAVRLAEVAMRGVEDEGRKQAFLQLMREMVADILEERIGERADVERACRRADTRAHRRTPAATGA